MPIKPHENMVNCTHKININSNRILIPSFTHQIGKNPSSSIQLVDRTIEKQVFGSIRWHEPVRVIWQYLQALQMHFSVIHQCPVWDCILQYPCPQVKWHMSPLVTAAECLVAKDGKQPKCPSVLHRLKK